MGFFWAFPAEWAVEVQTVEGKYKFFQKTVYLMSNWGILENKVHLKTEIDFSGRFKCEVL